MLDGILAISGEPGLYKLVSQNNKGIIVECIETQKRSPAYATNKISSLKDIAIYTEEEEMPLEELLLKIKEHSQSTAVLNEGKISNDMIKSYFKEVLPNYDEDRVYVSDMKKVFKWYNLLLKQDMLKEIENEATSEEDKQSEEK